MAKTYHIITFGCQMNERDSETLAGMLEADGFVKTEDKNAADVVILNTCSVRENADKKFFGVLGQLKHPKEADPSKTVCVCGCMMQQQHVIDTLKQKYPWVDLVFGTHNVSEFPKLLRGVRETNSKVVEVWEDGRAIAEGLPAAREYPFKAFVNIMYGCNNFCTYCIVPYTRGRERSRRPEDILAEVRDLAAHGCREITLLGQNVNSYGKVKHGEGSYCYLEEPEGQQVDFAKLLRMVDEVEGIERIRFMTSHPKDLSDGLIEAFRDCRHLCHAFHLPVQSGSNAILKKMNRHYDREKYFERVEKLREACPDIALSTDIIVGFPGETEEDFLETMDLVRRVRYDSAFTFLYSVRRGTPAAAMEDQVPEAVKHERFNRLIDLVHSIWEEKAADYQDKVLPVLIEGFSKTDASMLTGKTESGKTVDLPGDPVLIGQIVPVRITKAQTFSCYGELVK
jgi:tRNA-2-methylthio-N6-dimethylallyladenosine synthase